MKNQRSRCALCKVDFPSWGGYANHIRNECPGDELARFWALVEKEGHGGCWIYTGHRNRDGYGAIRINGVYLAHRLTWTLKYGAIAKGLHALHKCNNAPCCNPDHIYLGNDADNHVDMVAAKRSTWGERSVKAVLTADQVRAIRAEYVYVHRRKTNQPELARKYGVSTAAINAIVNGRTWRHL